jgi:hypothetical protein
MYAGTTLTPLSGRVLGAHQKIDRLAYDSVRRTLGPQHGLPPAKLILHFEGINGPDGIKRKSPAQDEPWHFYAPFDEHDTQLVNALQIHYKSLVQALKKDDEVRAAFEAAWLAHAIVDGLTPAHHYPYEAELAALRGGEGNETRTTYREKLLMPGDTRRQQVSNNWKMWGAKGLIMTHLSFEWGLAFLLTPLTAKQVALTPEDLQELEQLGLLELFRRRAKEIATLGLYEAYRKRGWRPTLARRVSRNLLPAVVKTVALAWYAALEEAGQPKASHT